MALENIFCALKNQGYIVKDLDLYLVSLANKTDENRAIDVNAPSQIGKCMRARYYARTGEQSDPNSISSRAQRIFDNGTYTHVRLQDYLKSMGKLLMDELPVYSKKYNIQGHTDGLFVIKPSSSGDTRYADKVGVLEIKSINERGFNALKDAKPEHKKQALTYAYCLEERRQELHRKYANVFQFAKSLNKRKEEYRALYQHVQGGHKYTREEKIEFQCGLHEVLDNILFRLKEPITEVTFLYENKNNQDLKEYTVSTSSAEAKCTLKEVLTECESLNKCVAEHTIPPREGDKKTCDTCRWCDYKIACWN